VLFADGRGRHYHDSPYTYFTPSDLHLGEISLECSRAGAAAAALWLTFRLLPPTPEGLGRILAVTRRAALRWADLIDTSSYLRLHQRPELDIVTYFPEASSLSALDRATRRVLHDGMHDLADPVYLSMFRVDADVFSRRHPDVVRDVEHAQVLRSVLLKPEAETHLDALHSRIEELVAEKERSVYAVDPTPVGQNDVAVRQATLADAEPLVELLCAAFHHDPLMEWIFPRPERRTEIMPGFFRAFTLPRLRRVHHRGPDGVMLTIGPRQRRRTATSRPDGQLAGEYGGAAGRAGPAGSSAVRGPRTTTSRSPGWRQPPARARRLLLRRCWTRRAATVPIYTETSSRAGQALAAGTGSRSATRSAARRPGTDRCGGNRMSAC
jgi:hypothetical protein